MYGGVVTKRFSGDGFQVIEAFPPTKLLAIHSDYPRLLIHGQQRFDNLEGSFPYFIPVPQMHSILFMTGGLGMEESFIVLDLTSGGTIKIPLERLIVGAFGIGRTGKMAMTVKSATPAMIVLQDDDLIYQVDLKRKAVTKLWKSSTDGPNHTTEPLSPSRGGSS